MRYDRYNRRWTTEKGKTAGFSLIEVLVAMAVLSVLLILLLQMTNSSGDLIRSTKKRMDSLVVARSALDRLAFDFDLRLRDTEVPSSFEKLTGNDKITFYLSSATDPASRQACAISYRVQGTQLERGVKAVSWSGTDMLAYDPAAMATPAATSFDPIAKRVLRMELSFLSRSTQLYTAAPPALPGDIAVIVIVIAVIDENEFLRLTTAQISALQTMLPDAVDGQSTIAAWNTALAAPPAVVPAQAANAVRLYQRCILLH